MKKVCIISPDTITLPLCKDTPETIVQDNTTYLLRDKCVKSTAIGKRAEYFAKFLAQTNNVTVLIPDINFPDSDFIDKSKLTFETASYCYTEVQWKFSDKLFEKLIEYDIVILQTTAGIGFDVVAKLPKNIFVIVDAWVPLIVEFPAAMSYHENQEAKIKAWNILRDQYSKLLKRADLILFANDRQKCFYEGQLYLLDALSVNDLDYNNKKLLRVPYGIEKNKSVVRKKHDGLKLLWYGAFYPWYDPMLLINTVKNHPRISVDFFGAKHPRYTNYFKTQFNLKEIESYKNIHLIEEYSLEDPTNLFSEYDACIMLSKNWIENKYSHRVRVLEVLSRNMPLIINKGSSLLEDLSFLAQNVHEVDSNQLLQQLECICEYKDTLNDIDISSRLFQIHEVFSWTNILTPLQEIIETL